MSNILRIITNKSLAPIFFICSAIFMYLLFISNAIFYEIYLAHDNITYHIGDFIYIVNSLVHGFGFPRWYPWEGGVPFGLLSINFYHTLPYRLIGYLLYLTTDIKPIAAYQCVLIIGISIVFIGWFLFLRKFFNSLAIAIFGSLMIFFGGSGLTVLHQEQALATMFWIPWVFLAFLKIQENKNYLYVVCVLIGLTMGTHSPHIFIISYMLVSISFFVSNRGREWLSDIARHLKLRHFIFSLFLFIISALPLLYLKLNVTKFCSPLRGNTVSIIEETYAEYANKGEGFSSAPISYYLQYLFIPEQFHKYHSDDKYVFYVTQIGLVLAVVGAFHYFSLIWPLLLAVFLLAWCSVGFNGGLPYLLFKLHFPSISAFREWYHFAPFVNYGISLLGCFGILTLKNVFSERKFKVVFLGLIVLLCLDSGLYSYLYIRRHVIHPQHRLNSIERFSKSEFLDLIIANNGFKTVKTNSLFAPIDFLSFKMSCHKFNNDINLKLNNKLDESFCNGTSIAFIPKGLLKEASSLNGKDQNDNLRLFSEKGPVFLNKTDQYRLTPAGVDLFLEKTGSGLVILPFCSAYGIQARSNSGKILETTPVFGGAMTALTLNEPMNVTIKMPFTLYEFSKLLEMFLLLVILLWVFFQKERSPNDITSIPGN